MPLPAGFSLRLAAFTDASFWSNESKVNGLWDNMFALNFPLDLNVGDVIITPESTPPGVKKLRPDLILFGITQANGLGLERVVYEGKSSASGDGWDQIDKQLNDYFTSRALRSKAWAIGARGSDFKVWVWNQQLEGQSLSAAGVPTPYGQSQGPTYDLTQITQPVLQGFLAAIVNPPP